jgi:RNA polymerase sigma-70 factor (ECF subfamily)
VIFRAALIRVGDRQLAEEILQDTYLALWNRAELFDSRMGSLIGWLAAIARNRSIDRLRALGRRPPPLPLGWLMGDSGPTGSAQDAVAPRSEPVAASTATNDPEIALEIGWLSAEVDRALAAMPPVEREVIRLAYYDELSQSEIAARLSWPLGTVKTRTRRALGRLRETLAVTLDETNGSR